LSWGVGLALTTPKTTENIMLIVMQNPSIALLREDKPIAIEYIEAVIAAVDSVGEPFIHASISNGSKGSSMCSKTHVKRSPHSSGSAGIRLANLQSFICNFDMIVRASLISSRTHARLSSSMAYACNVSLAAK